MQRVRESSTLADMNTSSMAFLEDKPRYKFRLHPQVSAHQMAEYLSATSTRRKAIIQAARFPKTAAVALYDHARDGLVSFLNDDTRSLHHITSASEALEKRHGRHDATEWVKRDSKNSIEAVDIFQRTYNRLGISKVECRAVTGRQPLLDAWPTKVSVNLDVMVRQRAPTLPKDKIGGAILLFSKGEASTMARAERSRVIAGLIYTHVNRFLANQGDPDPALCLAIDVLNGVSHRPPGTFARKLRNVEDACTEIAALWATVRAPNDYDGPPYD
jgi:hypothetical protein